MTILNTGDDDHFSHQVVSSFMGCFSESVSLLTITHSVIFLPAHPIPYSHFCFGTHILNLSESQDSQSYSGKFCNGRNDFLVGLALYSLRESWDA